MERDSSPKPMYALYATVTPPFNGKFFNREDEITNKAIELLQNPGHLRYLGWNLDTLDFAKIVQGGKAWEVKNGENKTIRLYPDGAVLALASLNNDFLGWGQSEKQFLQNPIINNLALVEYSFEFVDFVAHLYTLYGYEPGGVKICAAMRNTSLPNGEKLKISPNASDMRVGFGVGRNLVKIVDDFDDVMIEVDVPTLKENSKEVAFKLLERIFLHFNIGPSDIPFICDSAVNTEQIKQIS